MAFVNPASIQEPAQEIAQVLVFVEMESVKTQKIMYCAQLIVIWAHAEMDTVKTTNKLVFVLLIALTISVVILSVNLMKQPIPVRAIALSLYVGIDYVRSLNILVFVLLIAVNFQTAQVDRANFMNLQPPVLLIVVVLAFAEI